MSQEETLRLVAELLDKTSGPLREIQKTLKATADAAKGLHASGAVQAREHAKAYHELHEKMRKAKEVASEVMKPAFESLGIASLSLAGALAAISKSVQQFGEAGEKLTFLQRQSGATIGTIRALTEAGLRFGVSQEATTAGLAKFGAFMDQNARRAPDALNAWNQMPGAWARIGRSLVGLNRDAQVNKVLDFIPSVKYMDQRRKLLAIMGLPEDWANLTQEELIKVREAGKKWDLAHPMALANAAKSKEAWDNLAASLRGIRDDLGAAFGPGVVRGVEAVQNFLDDKGNIESFKTRIGGLGTEMEKTFQSTLRDIENIKAFYEWAKSLGGPSLPQGFVDSLTGKSKSPNLRPHSDSTPFGPAAPTDIEKNVRKPITEGVVEGLKQFFDSKNVNPKSGYQPMAFDPGGGGSGGGYFGSKDYPAVGGEGTGGAGAGSGGNPALGGSMPKGGGVLDGAAAIRKHFGGGAGGGGPTGVGGGGDTSLTGNSFLQSQRARFGEALKKNPQLRKELAGAMVLEDAKDPTPVAESLMNRMAMTGGSLHGGIHGGFYGPINRGRLPGAMAQLARNPKLKARMDAAIDAALAGSNLLKGATDQGMAGDPNAHWRGGLIRRGSGIYNDWGGGPGGHEGARRFREAQQRAVAGSGPTNLTEAAERHGAALRDHIRGNRQPQTDGELLKRGMKAVDAGSLNGSASLRIDLNGFPRGTKTSSTHEGLFKEVTLNRGRPMAAASETS